MSKRNTAVEKCSHSSEGWERRFDEASDMMNEYIQETTTLVEEVRYLRGYLSWKGLEEYFQRFREEAHDVVYPDLPFPVLEM